MATASVILPVRGVDGGFTCGMDSDFLLYDDTTVEMAAWTFRMPANYGSALAAKLLFSMATVQSGTLKVNWDVLVLAVAETEDIDTATYDTANSGVETLANNEAAGVVRDLSITLTNADSVAAGELCVISLERDADDGTDDTATGDAELRAISLEYTAA